MRNKHRNEEYVEESQLGQLPGRSSARGEDCAGEIGNKQTNLHFGAL